MPKNKNSNTLSVESRINAIVAELSIEEKAGQLNLALAGAVTGPVARPMIPENFEEEIAKGAVGGYFNGFGSELCQKLQRVAVEKSRLGIPLLFGADVIHGFRTVFPIPLAEAASWDLKAIEKSARVSAVEATATGINWTFVPSCDISRDPRWGRVAEASGEDPFLGSRIAEARVRGIQGDDLRRPDTMAACTKHMAAYGAVEGGRDYNSVDMSERQLREVYLPPYQATIDAGVATVMTSFNELNGVPATADKFLLEQILRQEWQFEGLVVSDYHSVAELVDHGLAESNADACRLALEAGTDMDMESQIYYEQIPELVRAGKLSESILDKSVRRVLKLKFDLGLFDDPFAYNAEGQESTVMLTDDHREAALDIARKSIVLLKNDQQLLPLSKAPGTLAVIGPLANNHAETLGCWSFFGEASESTTLLEGIQQKLGSDATILTANGCDCYGDSTALFDEALKVAEQADILILAVGETSVMTGESSSHADIDLPGVQNELIAKLATLNKPMVVVLTNGRPLTLTSLEPQVSAILETWFLGTESGHAIADILFGDANPSGKLPMTFPRHVGQIPIYYNHKRTGRPYEGDYDEDETERSYSSRYRDVSNNPLYPFGFGLSYTQFDYGNPATNKSTMSLTETLAVSVEVKNTGDRIGDEVVQLYIRDLLGSVTRPIKELKGFQRISLQPGEIRLV
ncbi:MAG: beta-glucosidase, partial [Gammaproteobacteria bacterium]